MAIVCPNCGYKQGSGMRCEKCSSLFAYHEHAAAKASAPGPRPSGGGNALAASPDVGGESVSVLHVLKRVYQVTYWSSLAILIVTIVLVLRKAPPPQIPTDPQAAARAEAKLRASDAATQAGQPHEVQLDKTEVNSFLSSNLALAGSAAAMGTPAATAPQAGSSAAVPDASGSPAGNGSASPAVAAPGPDASGEREPTLEEVQSSVKDVKVDMEGDLVKTYVLFAFHGKDLSLVLEGHLHAENGYIRFEPTSGMLGSLPLPQSALEAAVSRLMSSPENREKMRLPADISDLRVADGHLVVDYR